MSSWVTFKQSMSWAYSQEIEKINDTSKTHDCHHQSWGILKRFRYNLSTKTWGVTSCLPFLNGSSPISQKINSNFVFKKKSTLVYVCYSSLYYILYVMDHYIHIMTMVTVNQYTTQVKPLMRALSQNSNLEFKLLIIQSPQVMTRLHVNKQWIYSVFQ